LERQGKQERLGQTELLDCQVELGFPVQLDRKDNKVRKANRVRQVLQLLLALEATLVAPEYKDSLVVLDLRVKPDQQEAQDSLALMATLVLKVKKVSRASQDLRDSRVSKVQQVCPEYEGIQGAKDSREPLDFQVLLDQLEVQELLELMELLGKLVTPAFRVLEVLPDHKVQLELLELLVCQDLKVRKDNLATLVLLAQLALLVTLVKPEIQVLVDPLE